MCGQFFHVEDLQATGAKYVLHREQRKVREMLMVNRVELILVHQAHEMGYFNSHDAVWLEQQRNSLHEIIDIVDLCEDVVADDQIGLPAFMLEPLRAVGPEELHQSRHAPLLRVGSHVGRWVDTEHRNGARHEVLEQVAIIACEFHHLTGIIQ